MSEASKCRHIETVSWRAKSGAEIVRPIDKSPSTSAPARWGAMPEDWTVLNVLYGLTEDLLPVVCNPEATRSAGSKIPDSRKTPTMYNGRREYHGIKGSPEHRATSAEVECWSNEPDYGICIITRKVRAIDVDIEDPTLADRVEAFIEKKLGKKLPVRRRANSSKFLIPVRLAGTFKKRVIQTSAGKIEFLADGQQFIAAGTHKSGVRYEWDGGGSPPDFSEISPEEFESLWAGLMSEFGEDGDPSPSASTDSPLAPVSATVLSDLKSALLHIPADDREVWIKVGHALKTVGEPGLEMWREWSAGSDKYKPEEIDEKWRGFKPERTGFAAVFAEAQRRGWINPRSPGVARRREDFWAYLPAHTYIYVPTGEHWPAPSVNAHLPQMPNPATPGKKTSPAQWLDRNRFVVQTTWHPGEPQIIEEKVVQGGGWINKPGARVFNQYRPPVPQSGDPDQVRPWLDHVRRIYPDDSEHIVKWFAHRVQHPGEKLNHALVLGGDQGIGKDTLLEPVKHAVGPWNFSEISPTQMLGRFNGWARSVIVRISEARDLGDVNRFAFYEHSKTYLAAPPDVLRVDEKHLREWPCANVMGVIITSNNRSDGLYLPADDRRHYVAWSDAKKEDFDSNYWLELWAWYYSGGIGNVMAHLKSLDITEFDPKAPPPKTAAFRGIVNASHDPGDADLRDLFERMDWPDVVTLEMLIKKAYETPIAGAGHFELVDELNSRKTRRQIPHRLERCGYVMAPNPDAKDGLWRIASNRRAIYAKKGLSAADRIHAARRALL